MKYITILIIFIVRSQLYAQTVDSAYIGFYNSKMFATGYLSTNLLQLKKDHYSYTPNYPISAGVGLGIRNTVINFVYGKGIAPLKSQEYGKTKAFDFQIHNYGRKFLIDLYYQKYKGFYNENLKQTPNSITLYPNLEIQQIGAEGMFIFNNKRFSAKAAFEQSEKQLQSSGSWLLGSGIFWQRLVPEINDPNSKDAFENLQLGVNGGYAHSWVLGKHWLVTGVVALGTSFGNEIEALKDVKFKLYPTAQARASTSYFGDNWSVCFSMLINNKVIYPKIGSTYDAMTLNMQLAYVQQLDSFFEKKK